MKKQLFLFIAFGLFVQQLKAQCTGGPDLLCINTNGPCGNLHVGTVGQTYNDTISFWAPNRVDASVQSGGLYDSLDLVQFQISNVTGLPIGLSWSCGNSTCVYNPQPVGILANIIICGTAFVAGTYNLTIYTTGTVSTPIGNQSGGESFNLTLIIAQSSGGNSVFSFTPNQGCDSALVTFTPLMSFPTPQTTGYNWNFGGGNIMSTSNTNPITINYPTAGIYPVTCTTSVYNLALTNLSINVAGQSWWCGDFEELNCSNNNPDIVPTFTTGSTNWTGGEIADDATPTWSGMNFVFTGLSYSISLVEMDWISANDSPTSPYAGAITGAGTYNFNSPGNFSGSFTVSEVLVTQFIVTDTVNIYTTPTTDTIQATATSFCTYDSVTLSVYPGMYYQWYLNDTVLVQSGNNNTYTTSDAGNYHVQITDIVSGCNVVTDLITLNTFPIVPPGFPNVGIAETPPGTYTSQLSGAYTYQWLYFDGINYFPISTPLGTASSITPTINGIYCLVATNASGCSDTSNCKGFYLGAEEISTSFISHIYPNPSNGQINISIAHLLENVTLNVYNMVGQQVYSTQIIGTGSSVNEMHDFTFLKTGMYLIELRNNQNRFTQKLIIE